MANKLELTWVGKENRPRLEPRILIEEPEKSYHAKVRVGEKDIFDNRLIFGDNLLALKALEQEFAGKVKCIYIDPPYNTGSAFEHYDDGIEHSLWLTLIRDRLEILRNLLASDGAVFASIDDREGHYLKVLMDEIFGRANFVASFIWQKVDSPNDNKVAITPDHEFILCYAKDIALAPFRQKGDLSVLDAFSKRDDKGRLYRDRLLKKNGRSSLRTDRPSMFFPIRGPDGKDVYPIHDDGREACWAIGKEGVAKLQAKNELVWKDRGEGGKAQWVPYTREYAPDNPSRPYPTIWTDVQTMRQAKGHLKDLLPEVEVFATPKTEPLMQRIIEMCTLPGDLVLDSFAGSGTTGAVAHKMGRRWIMVEMGAHCDSHIVPRLRKVIEGNDEGGISEAAAWQGGGGFRYFRLGPSLIQQDQFGNPVINKEYNPEMLAEAMCKLEGFRFEPSADRSLYWMHGRSSETDFVYVTTQTLSREKLSQLSEEVGNGRTLLVCCGAFHAKDVAEFSNLTVKKIPKAVLSKCEWGRDDYSLQIAALPKAAPFVDVQPKEGTAKQQRRAVANLMDFGGA